MRLQFLLLFAFIITLPGFGQHVVQRNPKIEQLVQQISSDSLENYVRALASFKTRHTLNQEIKRA